MFEQIPLLAAAIAAPTVEERPLLEALCAAAVDEFLRRLRPGTTVEDCGSAFACAAAMTAAAGLLSCRSGGGVRQLSAGDVSLHLEGSGSEAQAASSMRQQAARMMERFWTDGGFAFAGVRG